MEGKGMRARRGRLDAGKELVEREREKARRKRVLRSLQGSTVFNKMTKYAPKYCKMNTSYPIPVALILGHSSSIKLWCTLNVL